MCEERVTSQKLICTAVRFATHSNSAYCSYYFSVSFSFLVYYQWVTSVHK